MESLKEKKQKL